MGNKFGSVMNTFSGLSGSTDEDQENLIVQAIEIARLGQYEAWDVVEPPKIIDTIKDIWHTLIQKAKNLVLISGENGIHEGKGDVMDEDWLVLGIE